MDGTLLGGLSVEQQLGIGWFVVSEFRPAVGPCSEGHRGARREALVHPGAKSRHLGGRRLALGDPVGCPILAIGDR